EVIGNPREADNWIGTRWVFSTIERETMNPTTKEVKTATKFIVSEYLGLAEDGADEPAAKPAAKKAAGTKKAAGRKPAAKKDGPPEGISQEHWDYYVQTAKDFDGD